MIDGNFEKRLQDVIKGSGRITVLTGAGISAESGIPTFRGPEGYWTAGSKVYQSQEMATYEMFSQKPYEVWRWYLYRIGICADAEPNTGHLALVEMERRFKERFTLITQNVDNLHLRAGNSLKHTFQIHGNIFYMRCANECSRQIHSVPKELMKKSKNDIFTDSDRRRLVCPACGHMTRPHVLWFDEMYDEYYYKYRSALKVAHETALLIIVGTSGGTSLPNQIVWEVASRKGMVVDINIEENHFSRLALKSKNGFFIKKPGSEALQYLLHLQP